MSSEQRCPVRGHDHALVELAPAYQRGTGARADRWECPTGRYRFYRFTPRGPLARLSRPRFGWSKALSEPLYRSAEEARRA